jgi:hypothetical protein
MSNHPISQDYPGRDQSVRFVAALLFELIDLYHQEKPLGKKRMPAVASSLSAPIFYLRCFSLSVEVEDRNT